MDRHEKIESLTENSGAKSLRQLILDRIFNQEFKDKLVLELNKKVDVPFISEKTEAKVLYALVEVIEDVIEEQVKKII